jgi:hypothetical protein
LSGPGQRFCEQRCWRHVFERQEGGEQGCHPTCQQAQAFAQ